MDILALVFGYAWVAGGLGAVLLIHRRTKFNFHHVAWITFCVSLVIISPLFLYEGHAAFFLGKTVVGALLVANIAHYGFTKHLVSKRAVALGRALSLALFMLVLMMALPRTIDCLCYFGPVIAHNIITGECSIIEHAGCCNNSVPWFMKEGCSDETKRKQLEELMEELKKARRLEI